MQSLRKTSSVAIRVRQARSLPPRSASIASAHAERRTAGCPRKPLGHHGRVEDGRAFAPPGDGRQTKCGRGRTALTEDSLGGIPAGLEPAGAVVDEARRGERFDPSLQIDERIFYDAVGAKLVGGRRAGGGAGDIARTGVRDAPGHPHRPDGGRRRARQATHDGQAVVEEVGYPPDQQRVRSSGDAPDWGHGEGSAQGWHSRGPKALEGCAR